MVQVVVIVRHSCLTIVREEGESVSGLYEFNHAVNGKALAMMTTKMTIFLYDC